MAKARQSFPDLSKPMGASDAFPDLSQPIAQEQIQPIKTTKSKMTLDTILKDIGLREPENVLQERRLGGLESALNAPIEIANIFANKPYSKFDFGPKTKEADIGRLAADVATFGLPGGAISTSLKGLEFVPGIGKGLNAVKQGIQNTPYLNTLLNIGRTAGEGAIFGARKEPENEALAAATGGALGGGTALATNLLTSTNPLIRTLARLGLGGAIGQSVGHPGSGMVGAALFPQIAAALGAGTSKNAIAQEMLEGITPRDVSRALAANERLGTPITPAQASGNYVTAATEGNLKRSPEAGQLAYRLEEGQKIAQNKAINQMLDNIYQPTPANEAHIQQLYGLSHQMSLTPSVVARMKQDPILEAAFQRVKRDPAFSKVPENNYKFLAEVDRELWRTYLGDKYTHPNSARETYKVKNAFNNFLKSTNPAYAAATKAAQPKMVRENIESKFNRQEEDFTGKNFYNRFLNSKRPYQELLQQTKNFPEAQQAIKDMRAGWKHLSNMKTVSQGEAQAKTGLGQARNYLNATIEAMAKLSGARKQTKALKYIYSDQWGKDFDRIMEIKNQSIRNRELANFLGRIGLSYGLR